MKPRFCFFFYFAFHKTYALKIKQYFLSQKILKAFLKLRYFIPSTFFLNSIFSS